MPDEIEPQAVNLLIEWDDLQKLIRRAHAGEDPEVLWLEYFANNYIDQEPRSETDQPTACGRCDCE